ncbi:hypothetical protein [Promicromonospora soli]|uniref:hypothetical protein n=1 Tax=Promicromonospora soli TaxID=2035533 RepID=UPI0016752F33|nr:hypothetical protein [Promicromonospora soli]
MRVISFLRSAVADPGRRLNGADDPDGDHRRGHDALAQTIVETQNAEIEAMENLLTSM